jgi:transketolase
MRKAFISTLEELAADDSRIVFLTGDVGFRVLENFRKEFPQRFFNVGVAEQNMIGLATGLAKSGFIPFVYSMATFASLRPYEFIRNGPLLHRLPVRIIGVGGGFDYGYSGITHYGLEDVGLMRIQPGMTVVVPADYLQARSALLATWAMPNPIYYRLGKDDKTAIAGLGGRFQIGKAQIIREGKDLLFIMMGSIANEVVGAAKILSKRGISCKIMVVASVSPPPIQDLVEALSQFKVALTIEAHYIRGALGSLVSELVAEKALYCRVIRCGINDAFGGVSGSRDFLYRKHGLSARLLAVKAIKVLRKT